MQTSGSYAPFCLKKLRILKDKFGRHNWRKNLGAQAQFQLEGPGMVAQRFWNNHPMAGTGYSLHHPEVKEHHQADHNHFFQSQGNRGPSTVG